MPPEKTYPKSFEEVNEALFGANNSGSGLPPGTDREAFQRDAFNLKQRLNKMQKGLLDPLGPRMQRWDMCIMFAMLYTTFVTPFELAFIREMAATSGLFIFNQLINAIFVIDICFQFFLPVKEAASKGGRTVRNHARIAKLYMKGWFPIDIVSVLPIDILDVAKVFEKAFAGDVGGASTQVVKLVRLLRLLKLLKLARLLRASRVLVRYENRLALTFPMKESLKYLLLIAVTLHWLACCWACLAQFAIVDMRSPELALRVQERMEYDATCEGCSSELGIGDECRAECLTSCEIEELALHLEQNTHFVYNRQHWMCRAVDHGWITNDWESIAEIWVFCMVVALGQLSGGALTIAPLNPAENILFFLALLSGSVIWAMVQGVVCGIVTTGDPHYIEHRQNMDQLNFLMADMAVETPTRIRVREYFRNTLSLKRRQAYNEQLDLLSPMLMTDVTTRMSSWVVKSLPWMQRCEPDFLRDLFRRMERVAYAVKEKIHADKINVLNVGVVARGGKILMPSSDRGPVWGDILLTAPALRNMSPARALTYAEVTRLDRETLDEVMDMYPDSAARVRQAAMRQALIKATDLIDKQVKRKRERAELAKAGEDAQKRITLQHQMYEAFGGDEEEYGGPDGGDDPDSVLRMICGVGGMKYREIDDDGNIIGEEDDDHAEGSFKGGGGGGGVRESFSGGGGGGGGVRESFSGGGGGGSVVLAELRQMKADMDDDAQWTTSRLDSLHNALLRSTGVPASVGSDAAGVAFLRRDQAFLMRRPAVQRALNQCASLADALGRWRRHAGRDAIFEYGFRECHNRRLLNYWNLWLAFSVRRMRGWNFDMLAHTLRLKHNFVHWASACGFRHPSRPPPSPRQRSSRIISPRPRGPRPLGGGGLHV